MKILIVHSFYSVDGGENKRVSEDLEMFKSEGHEVLLYSKKCNKYYSRYF